MNLQKFLPLTETTFYILLSLLTPSHGYAIMQTVEVLSEGNVKIAPGTLYGALENLKKQSLISYLENESEQRRKVYALTELGLQVLHLEYKRMARLVSISTELLGGKHDE